jgi:hypothetical protein
MTDRQTIPRYLEKLLGADWVPSPGESVEVNIYHDEDCSHLGGDLCDCNPTPELTQSPVSRKEGTNV